MHIHHQRDRKFQERANHPKTGLSEQIIARTALLEGDAFIKLETFQWKRKKKKPISLAKVWK